MAKFVFGPVPSRRLGFSLGVDIIPSKYCCFDCIYCQIGKTTNKEITRKSFFDPYKIIDEVIEKVKKTSHIDYISFSGSGEPTLNADIGIMIEEIKKITKIPISVITNGALLYQDDVRKDLMLADIVLPSLDAVSEDIFRYVNRPHSALEPDTIIRGLKRFSALVRAEAGGAFPRGQQGAEHAAGGRVLNNAAAGAAGLELLRQAEHPGYPVEHVRLQLGASRAGGP